MQNIDGYKYCPGCKNFKDTINAFGKDPTRKDGRQIYCKVCRSAKYKAQSDFEPETVFYSNSDYPSRGSVPFQMREQFDGLMALGGLVFVETPAGNRIAWEDID